MKLQSITLVLLSAFATFSISANPSTESTNNTTSVTETGSSPRLLQTGFGFTEGGATDSDGNILFTDLRPFTIHKWDATTEEVTLFLDETQKINGVCFDADQNLIACQSNARRIISIAPDGSETVLTDNYNGGKFNSPNDLWIDSKGGIYFTDPRYGKVRDDMELDGEHVFYISPDHSHVTRVTDDLKRPNGIIGSVDGKTLYIGDTGLNKIFAYTIEEDGTLTNKRIFVDTHGSDGFALDTQGNLYTTSGPVRIYAPDGTHIQDIELPEKSSNVCFAGTDRKTLFITARKSIYAIPLNLPGHSDN